MELDKKTVDQIAELAKLEFSESEKEDILKDLNKIIGWVDQLNEVDTSGVDEMLYITDEVNDVREDKIVHRITKEEALSNAPLHDSDYIKVAKVITSKTDHE